MIPSSVQPCLCLKAVESEEPGLRAGIKVTFRFGSNDAWNVIILRWCKCGDGGAVDVEQLPVLKDFDFLESRRAPSGMLCIA